MRAVTLLGMSGVGKTTLSLKAPQAQWFHYSVDYRIGTRYLGEEINDALIKCAMQSPALASLLRSDSIYIGSNISFGNLAPLSQWVGKIGDTAKGGLPLTEFKRRQALHRDAEIQALLDVERFMQRAGDLYGYQNFLVDAGGSIIEVVDVDNPDQDPVLNMLKRIGSMIYIQAVPDLYSDLVERSIKCPKPMYYNPEFLDESLDLYLSQTGETDADLIDPDSFVRFMIPRCTDFRADRYRRLLSNFGHTITSDDAMAVKDETAWEALLSSIA